MKKLILYSILQIGVSIVLAQHSAELIVHAPVLAQDDTLQIHLQDDRIGEPNRAGYRTMSAVNANGIYRIFVDSIDHHSWLGMNLSYQKRGNYNYLNILDEFLLMEGDSVHMYLEPKKGVFYPDEEGYDGGIPIVKENWQARFEGRGAARYELQWEIETLSESDYKKEMLSTIDAPYPTKNFLLLYKLEAAALTLLESSKACLETGVYEMLTKQIQGQFGSDIGRRLEVGYFYNKPKEPLATLFQTELDRFLAKGKKDLEGSNDNVTKVPKYLDYLSKYVKVAFYAEKPKSWDIDLYFDFSKILMKPSLVRDRLLSRILLENFIHKPQKALLEEALSTIQDPYSRNHVIQLKSLLKGTNAYDFSMPDVNGIYHKAADFKGKVVFMDFWYAACGPCKKYMRDVVGPVKEYYKENPNVIFITVSTDSHQVFSTMLSQSDFLPKGGIHLYTDNLYFKHPIINHYNIQSYPYPLLIDKACELLAMGSELDSVEKLKRYIELVLVK